MEGQTPFARARRRGDERLAGPSLPSTVTQCGAAYIQLMASNARRLGAPVRVCVFVVAAILEG